MTRGRRQSLAFELLAACILLCGWAFGGEAGYKQMRIQDLFGAAWPTFSAQLNSLMINPRDEDGFYRMFNLAQSCDAASKVPQYLRLLAGKDPENPRLKTLLGLFYKEIFDYNQAIAYFREALQKAPDDYYAHYQLAHLLAKQEAESTFKEALEHYKTAAERVGGSDVEHKSRIFQEWGELVMDRSSAPDEAARKAVRETAAQIWDRLVADERRFDKITYERLAQIYQRYEMYEKAIATYQSCLANVIRDDNPARVMVLDAVGQLSEKVGNLKGAVDAFNQALALVDENHWLHKQLVVKILKCRKRLGEEKAYVAELEKAVGDRPQSVGPLRDLALAHEGMEATAAAVQDLEKAHQLAPRDIPIISDLLLLYAKLSDTESRTKKPAMYRKLIDAMPENFEAYVALADACWDLGDTAKTQEALQLLQDNASRLPEKDLILARAYRKYGMATKARNAFERVVAADPTNTDAVMELCDFSLQMAINETPKAGTKDVTTEVVDKESLQRAVEMRDSLMAGGRLDESGYLRLMQIFENRKRLDEARDIIGYAAVKAFPQSFLCRSALADLHYSRKEFHKAIQHYVLALAMAPNFYFKRMVNDRLVTLTFNYGRRAKNFMEEPTEDERKKNLLGGAKGEGLAPWIYYLRLKITNNPQDGDSMMLLAQINDTTQVDAKLEGLDIKTDLASSLSLYQSVVDMDLKNLDAHAALARSHAAADNIKEAVQENWVLEELSPVGKWQFIMNSGDIFAFAGEKDKALKNWDKVKEQATTEPNLVYQLAVRMYQMGKLDAAIELARKAVSGNKNQFRFHVMLANLLDEAGRSNAAQYADAVTEFKVAVEMAGQNPALAHFLTPVLRRLLEVQIALGRSHWEGQRLAAALPVYTDALATAEKLQGTAGIDNVQGDLKVQQARCLLALGKKAEGEELLRKTTAAQPTAEYWLDSLQSIRGQHLLALYDSGKYLATVAVPKTTPARVTATPKKIVRLPTVINSVQKGVADNLWIEAGSQFYRASSKDGALDRLNIAELGPGTLPHWLGGDQVGLANGQGFISYDLAAAKPLWKVDGLAPLTTTEGKNLLAIFHAVTTPADPQKKTPATSKTFFKLIEKDTGKQRWQIDVGLGEVSMADSIFALKTSSELIGLSPNDGKIMWRSPLALKAIWRRPAIAGDALLLVNDMDSHVVAFDLRSGEVHYTRDLCESLLCDPIVLNADRVVFHTLRKRTVTLQCLDVSTGKLAWEAGLAKLDQKTEKDANPPRMEGMSLPPLLWQGYLLHLDLPRHCIWPVQMDSGAVGEPFDFEGALEGMSAGEVSSWDVSGSTLILVAKTGRIALVTLSIK